MNSIQTEEALWIIMEYCGGGSITDVIASNGLPLDESTIAYVCSEALKGLSYLHAMNKVRVYTLVISLWLLLAPLEFLEGSCFTTR